MYIYANILQKSWGPLYTYLFDLSKGSGKVANIAVADIAKDLQKSPRTINRHLKDCPGIRAVIRHKTGNKFNGYITVYLKSWKKIQKELDMDLGPRFEGDLDCLINNKHYAVLAQALALQAKSYYGCRKELAKEKKKRKKEAGIKLPDSSYEPFTFSPTEFFKDTKFSSKDEADRMQPSQKVKGQLHQSSKSSTTKFFMCSAFRTFGASNKTIAKACGLSIRRVITLLKKATKVNIYQFDPKYYSEYEEAKYLDGEEGTDISNRYYWFKNMIYKSMPNIYYPLLTLCGGKYPHALT